MSFSSAPAPAVSAQLRLHLFGQFRLETQSRLIHIPTHKVESLLAYLVLNPQLQTREKLATLFWGDMPDTPARHSLRTALALRRKALGAAFLIADRTTAQLNPGQPLGVAALAFH